MCAFLPSLALFFSLAINRITGEIKGGGLMFLIIKKYCTYVYPTIQVSTVHTGTVI